MAINDFAKNILKELALDADKRDEWGVQEVAANTIS